MRESDCGRWRANAFRGARVEVKKDLAGLDRLLVVES